ncbi:MAG: DNA maturase B [Spirochaetia bacterium]|nr:DNA maturase B [Spirochaetia bacterium]
MSIEKQNAQIERQLKEDFVAFLFILWKALNLPPPTKCQIDMARTLASGSRQRFILQAFRGIGKSFITCAYVVWLLWRDPQLKIMIVSASKERADANSIFIKNIINLLPFLHHLKPRPEQRDSVISFDVGPALPDHSPSVKSVGITGQLTGSRADIIIADDVEVPNNSATQTARDKLWELVKEFDAILKPLETSKIIYLGTPQCEMTLYRELENRGYETVVWPVRFPLGQTDVDVYGNRLAPMVLAEIEAAGGIELCAGLPLEPVRFDSEEIRKRELSYGKAGFALQFMLNPSLSDAEKYPLRLRDCIVAALESDKAPLHYQWLPNPQNELQDVPNVGLRGDRFHRFHTVSDKYHEYTSKILVIDPSGRGKDETAWAVLYSLNGYIYLMDVGGFRGGYEDKTLESLAKKAQQWKVNTVVFESNFGDGMFGKIFQPVLLKFHHCVLEEYRSTGQKEVRICDTLEPLIGNHRLVVREEAIRSDYQTARDADGNHDPSYSLFYQWTRMSRERGAVAHDDRLDAVAIGCDFLKEHVMADEVSGAKAITEEFIESHMEEALKGFDTTRKMTNGDVTIQWEDEYGNDNFMDW